MAQSADHELVDRFEQFYRNYYREEIGELAQRYPNEQRSLAVDWTDLYQFDPDVADDYLAQPDQLRDYAEEALRLYDLPIDVSLGQAHVRLRSLPESTEIRAIRSRDVNTLVSVGGIVRKATDVRPRIEEAAFECQRCGTLTYIPQNGGFQEPHECQGCERQGPFTINYDQSTFVDAQKLRVQESPEGLRGGETPQSIDVHIEDDITGRVSPGDRVTVTGVLRIEQQSSGNQKSRMFDVYMDGHAVVIEDEEFESMDITEADKQAIIELSSDEEAIYDRMVGSIAPTIYGFEQEKLAICLQLFSGVTKHLPDNSRIRGDLHVLLIGDPGTGKSQILQYIRHIAPRAVYTSGKGSSAAGLTAAAVRDDFGDGQQWSLEAGALVLADKGIAAVDELDKMRCVVGDTLVHTPEGIVPIGELARDARGSGEIEEHENGRTIRDADLSVWTMTDDGRVVSREVTAVHEYPAPRSLYEVSLESGESVTATADHPFFVLENGERVEKPAGELEDDDWVYVPESVPRTAADGGNTPASVRGNRPGEGLTPAHGAILGYIAGDGNVYYNRGEGSYGIRFTNKEEELLGHFERVCRRAFDGAAPVRHPSEQRDDGVGTVRLHGKRYVDRLLDAGLNLEIFEGKRLAREVTWGSDETKAAFVRALADSEGTVDRRTVKITSSSYELLIASKMLLSEFGVTSQIQTRNRDGKRDVYILAITADESLRAFRQHVGFTLDRKQRALERACERTSGDRTIIDVLPECGDLFAEARASLRLYQSECGLNDVTYRNFENGDANFSFDAAETVLARFERRRREARRDVEGLTSSGSRSWEELASLKERYHIAQRELAERAEFSQHWVSEHWGESERLRRHVGERIESILRDVVETDLARLSELVRGDVKWRRVADVRRRSPEHTDPRLRVIRHRLADLIGGPIDSVEDRAAGILSVYPEAETWSHLRTELDRHRISFSSVADRLGVADSTVSRWFTRTVEVGNFETVRGVCFDLIDHRRDRIRALATELEDRRKPRVYDLTVEETHNFVANNLIVHNSEDRSAMHEALEQQQISISKAGINATLKSRCSLLGAANPKYGRFDQYEPMAEQIDLEPALVSRFDLIFTVTDKPDEERDRELAEHILQTNYAGELNTQHTELASPNVTQEDVDSVSRQVEPTIEPELFRKYIAYAKRNVFPSMTEEAREAIRDFYVDLRSQGTGEDAPVPVTARKLEALVRLAEASARVRLSDTVEREDAERVIEIVRSSLRDIGIDPETGQFDADVVETGTSKTQRDRKKTLRSLIQEIEGEYEEGAPIDEIVSRAGEIGIEESKVEHEIEQLKQRGELYEPSTNHLRTT